MIDEPSCVTPTRSTVLYLIISDSPDYIISTGALIPPSNCDHNIIFADLNISLKKPRSFKRIVRNFENVNVNYLNATLLNANLGSDFSDPYDSIDVVYHDWFDLFKSILDAYIPCKKIIVWPKDKPWMNSSIR